MLLIVDMASAFVAGFMAHVIFRRPFKRDFVDGWLPLVSYTCGVLLAMPFVLLLYHHSKRDTLHHVVASYLLAFLGVGSGVAVGYYVLPDY